MEQVVIGTVGVLFALMGLYGLLAPASLLAPFGTEVTSADGRNEVRAVYGGFGLAMALALIVAAADTGGLRDGVVAAVALALAGMGAGRVISMCIDRPSRFYPTVFYLLVELALAAALLMAR
ncbi:DUF4345 domain-containing protein [Actinomadura yumaensis]|uniref:DUF4345 domain-containing protein n=1 Tax=Actinomadura yumaensis TaxID=111807 RepID=A0ABW2CLC5_9ACTN